MEGRTGGYHTGLDIRTQGRTGLPVRTPVPGHVTRVRTSPDGYGKAVYLDIGGGRSLVFAHLSAFADPIQALVTVRQASTREYEQDLVVPAGTLRFAAGEVIALSGDTGIGAPHLHLEVREGEVPVNPIDFFEVPDTADPVITAIEVLPRRRDAQIQRALGPARVAHGDTVRIHGPVAIRVGVVETTGVNAFGLMPRRAELELDDGRTYAMAQDAVAFADRWQRGLELQRDDAGARWLSLFRHPDNTLRGPERGFDGFVELRPGERIGAVVRVRDHAGRGAAVRFVLEGVRAEPSPPEPECIPVVESCGGDLDEAVFRFDGGLVVWKGVCRGDVAGRGVGIVAVETDAPGRHDGVGLAFEVAVCGVVAFRRGIDVSVDVPGDPREYTLNSRDRKGRWAPESGVAPDPVRGGAIRTRLTNSGVYRVIRDVTPPSVGPWRVGEDPVRGNVTLSARERVVHGVTLSRWPAVRLDVADAIAGIDPDDVRVTVDGQPYPARPELEDDHVWIEWDVDPGAGVHEITVEVADRLGNRASSALVVELVE